MAYMCILNRHFRLTPILTSQCVRPLFNCCNHPLQLTGKNPCTFHPRVSLIFRRAIILFIEECEYIISKSKMHLKQKQLNQCIFTTSSYYVNDQTSVVLVTFST